MDLHFWSMLCYNCVHPFLSQLQNLVFPWSWYDHLYCLVHDHISSCSWTGNLPNQQSWSLLLVFNFLDSHWFIFLFIDLFNFYCFTGWKRSALSTNKVGSVFHWGHQYTVHFRWTCCHCVSGYLVYIVSQRYVILFQLISYFWWSLYNYWDSIYDCAISNIIIFKNFKYTLPTLMVLIILWLWFFL